MFSRPASQEDPAERILSVLLNYLTSLHRQYYLGQPIEAGTKKPLNPFLGELFFCSYASDSSNIKVISEQVSHHPPTTACFMSDEKNGMHAEGYSTQHTSLSGTSVVVRQSGHAIVTIDKYNESYLLPFPDVYAKSVLSGKPYPDLDGEYRIVSTSGYVAEIHFGSASKSKTRSILSVGGGKNEFNASIHKVDDKNKKPTYELSGCWSDSWTVKDGSGKEVSQFNVSDPKNMAVKQQITPMEKQSPWESRRAWQTVAEGLREGDFGKALGAKSKLENGQREMRKKEKAEGKHWESVFFEKVNEEEELNEASALGRLVKVGAGENIREVIGSNGCWRFSPEKERKFKDGKRAMPQSPVI